MREGKTLAFLLRHDKEALVEGVIDRNGWRDVRDLVTHHGYTIPLLETIVTTDDKGRYEFDKPHTKIRARQGHSIDVDVGLCETVPPITLYHGTAVASIDAIYRDGIKPQSRLYVHLSSDMETAFKVGSRHGKPCAIEIDTVGMIEHGMKFYLSNNGVWLTPFVDKSYIKRVHFQYGGYHKDNVQ